jgi:hypothetical protein
MNIIRTLAAWLLDAYHDARRRLGSAAALTDSYVQDMRALYAAARRRLGLA